MAESNEASQDQALNSPNQTGGQDGALTPALVREVANKVYALLLADLRIEQERFRLTKRPWQNQVGTRRG